MDHPDQHVTLHQVSQGATGVIWRFEVSNSDSSSRNTESVSDSDSSVASPNDGNGKNPLSGCSNMVLKIRSGSEVALQESVKDALSTGGALHNTTGILGFSEWQHFDVSNTNGANNRVKVNNFQWMPKMDSDLESWLGSRPSMTDGGRSFIRIARDCHKDAVRVIFRFSHWIFNSV